MFLLFQNLLYITTLLLQKIYIGILGGRFEKYKHYKTVTFILIFKEKDICFKK